MSEIHDIAKQVIAAGEKATPRPWECGRLLKDYAGDYVIWQAPRKKRCDVVVQVGGFTQPLLPAGEDVLFEAEKDNAAFVTLIANHAAALAERVLADEQRIAALASGYGSATEHIEYLPQRVTELEGWYYGPTEECKEIF